MLTKYFTVPAYELFARVEQVNFIAHDSDQLIIQAQKHLSKKGFWRKTLNSVALVRTRTIPTERPPPVGEVSANFCG